MIKQIQVKEKPVLHRGDLVKHFNAIGLEQLSRLELCLPASWTFSIKSTETKLRSWAQAQTNEQQTSNRFQLYFTWLDFKIQRLVHSAGLSLHTATCDQLCRLMASMLTNSVRLQRTHINETTSHRVTVYVYAHFCLWLIPLVAVSRCTSKSSDMSS